MFLEETAFDNLWWAEISERKRKDGSFRFWFWFQVALAGMMRVSAIVFTE